MSEPLAFQDRTFPDGMCFGCGPANEKGLRIKSLKGPDGTMIADWTPGPEHQAAPDRICGGVLGALMDCHGAAVSFEALGLNSADASIATKEFTVRFLAPTPRKPIHIVGRAAEVRSRSVRVEAHVECDGQVCAEFEGVFVVPRP